MKKAMYEQHNTPRPIGAEHQLTNTMLQKHTNLSSYNLFTIIYFILLVPKVITLPDG